jgi:hypothetical protein
MRTVQQRVAAFVSQIEEAAYQRGYRDGQRATLGILEKVALDRYPGENDPPVAAAPPSLHSRQARGGTRRAMKLTPERRSEIARTAAAARWAAKGEG